MRSDNQEKEVQPAIELWLQSVRGLLSPIAGSVRSAQKEKDVMGAILSRCELAAKLMQKSFQNIQKPPPDILPKLTGIWGKEIIDSQFQLLEKMVRFFTANPGDGKDVLNSWNTFYEKEVKPLLNLPQVGLARYYQERSNQLLDKFNAWNKASLEFLYMISAPLDESFCMLQREMEGGDQAKRLTQGMKGIYQVWVKQLESLYQSLFRSSEFIKCLSDTLDALEDFVRARMEYMQDLGKALQLPTMKDLDEAYRELYLLKKEVQSIKKGKRASVTDS